MLLGCGWGEESQEPGGQGNNFIPGNVYIAQEDLEAIDVPTVGSTKSSNAQPVNPVVTCCCPRRDAYQNRTRLFGFFGVAGGQGRKPGHLPYQTADGSFNPTKEKYDAADVTENPTLADMAQATIGMLSANKKGFWLMIEAGDGDCGQPQ